MNLKLLLAAKWIPQRIIKQELAFIAESTISLLNILLREHHLPTEPLFRIHKKQSAQQIRENMALSHELQVRRLVEHIGYERALESGRPRMYMLGQRIGSVFKNQFDLSTDPDDTRRAVEIMYRILRIKFNIREISTHEALLFVTHCSLARYYSEHTCALLCAADEGVINGFNSAFTMRFRNYLTQGHAFCLADLHHSHCTEQVLCRP